MIKKLWIKLMEFLGFSKPALERPSQEEMEQLGETYHVPPQVFDTPPNVGENGRK